MCKSTTKTDAAVWSVYQFLARFPDEEAARLHIERLRWNGEPVCPHCGGICASETKDHKPMPYRCRDCRRHFSVRTGTIFEKAKLPLQKCLLAIYLLTIAKKGVPSTQLARELDCTQKTAWFLAHRIRLTLEQGGDLPSGEIEADETYIGEQERNKHADKRLNAGRGAVGKCAVVGLLERGGDVKARPIKSTRRTVLHSEIKSKVKPGAVIYTDDFRSYRNLVGYGHETVSHSVGQYVNGMAHTNGVESFWSLLKRGYHDVYHKMSEKHLHRYVDEFATRHNKRSHGTETHIGNCIRSMVGKSMSYKELIQ